jgi:hypothetical protein
VVNEAISIPGYFVGAVVAVAAVIGATVAFQRWFDARYVTRREFNPEECPTKEECALRHRNVDEELERRASRTHDLANEMQGVKLMLAKLDKGQAVTNVLLKAMARDRGLEVAVDED